MEHANERLQLLIKSFREVNKAFYRFFREEAERLEITAIQLMVILKLSKEDEISLGELSKKMQMSNSTMSGIIDRLVQAEIVKRDRARDDRRVNVLKLTDSGMALKNEAFGPNSYIMKRLSQMSIPEEDVQKLLELHQNILRQLENKEDSPPNE